MNTTTPLLDEMIEVSELSGNEVRRIWSEMLELVADLIPADDAEVDLTVSTNDEVTRFGWQTGDNSFSGGAYGNPHWAVVTLTSETVAEDALNEIADQLLEALSQL